MELAQRIGGVYGVRYGFVMVLTGYCPQPDSAGIDKLRSQSND